MNTGLNWLILQQYILIIADFFTLNGDSLFNLHCNCLIGNTFASSLSLCGPLRMEVLETFQVEG